MYRAIARLGEFPQSPAVISAFAWRLTEIFYYTGVRLLSRFSRRLEGTMRGVDFYPRPELRKVLRRALRDFYYANGHLPNVFTPRTFNERLFYRKFLEHFHLPVLADKLYLNQLIKKNFGEKFVAEIVAATKDPDELVPTLGRISAGTYFLKANNGSGTNHKFTVPASGLSEADIGKLVELGRGFLERRFGYAWGEWFYQTFEPTLFIEKSVSDDDPVDWRFFVVNGAVKLIRVTTNFYTRIGVLKLTYAPDWQLLSVDVDTPMQPAIPKPENLPEMVDLALKVAACAKMNFCRIDLYCIEGQLIVGEVTYTPGDGLRQTYNQPWFRNMWD